MKKWSFTSSSEPVFPTRDLEALPELWAEAERRFPPSEGWSLKIFRRWLRVPHDGAVWGVSFTRDSDEGVSADDVSPTAAFRSLLDPDSDEKRHASSIRHIEELITDAEDNLKARRAQLEDAKAGR